MPHIFLIGMIVTVLVALVGAVLFFRWRLSRRDDEKLLLEEKIPSYELREYEEAAHCNDSKPIWEAQDPEWQKQMQLIGQRLYDQGVGVVFFIHGTFVGADPFDISRLLERGLPHMSKRILKKIIDIYNRKKDSFIGDKGIFSDEYVALFEAGIGKKVACHRFTWSSGNHHYARLTATLGLIDQLSSLEQSNGSTFLLIGHSHGGQLFALMTQMIDDFSLAKELVLLAVKGGFNTDEKSVIKNLRILKGLSLDFVTLGTPRRYRWKLSPKQRVLHMINHRGKSIQGGIYGGILGTRDGDYVQQWGIEGSDSLSPIIRHAQINNELNDYLGIGFGINHWSSRIRMKQRLHPVGHNLLVDYKDKSRGINFFGTMFGHGIYTRYQTMLFNMKEIIHYFY
ncbi:MAG: hypothetical protein HRU09_06465 [Oligoflexales bacterium]|nr:hypothetical protein [Oligoflexales bacterium]